MKKILTVVAVAMVMVLSGAPANADFVVSHGPIYRYLAASIYDFDYSFDLSGLYDQGTESISWATLTLNLGDDFDGGSSEKTDVYIGNTVVDSAREVDGNFWSDPLSWEYDVASLITDDTVSYQLAATEGDFYYLGATLQVGTQAGTIANPIPGTVWLFGLGLVGLVTMRRRST